MLTKKELSSLAPHLARIRTTRAALARAGPEADAARLRLDGAKNGTGWRVHLFGGRLSREPARARAYHDARRAHARAAAAALRLKRQHARHLRRIDARIRPMMPRLDLDYPRFAIARRHCDRALRECLRMRQRIVTATAMARTASATPGQDDKAARAAERARRQYPQLLTKVLHTASDVGRALDSARRAVRAAGGDAQHLAWNAALFDPLPQLAADFSARRQPIRGHDPLRRLHSQVNEAIATVDRWRAETRTAEANAVAAARDRLLDEPGQ